MCIPRVAYGGKIVNKIASKIVNKIKHESPQKRHWLPHGWLWVIVRQSAVKSISTCTVVSHSNHRRRDMKAAEREALGDNRQQKNTNTPYTPCSRRVASRELSFIFELGDMQA